MPTNGRGHLAELDALVPGWDLGCHVEASGSKPGRNSFSRSSPTFASSGSRMASLRPTLSRYSPTSAQARTIAAKISPERERPYRRQSLATGHSPSRSARVWSAAESRSSSVMAGRWRRSGSSQRAASALRASATTIRADGPAFS